MRKRGQSDPISIKRMQDIGDFWVGTGRQRIVEKQFEQTQGIKW